MHDENWSTILSLKFPEHKKKTKNFSKEFDILLEYSEQRESSS